MSRQRVIYHRKLVRDKVVQDIWNSGYNPITVQLSGYTLLNELKNKLIEEAREVYETRSRSAMLEELADVTQVMYALMDFMDISIEEIRLAAMRKAEEKGTFSKGTYLLACEDILYRDNKSRMAGSAVLSAMDGELQDSPEDQET